MIKVDNVTKIYSKTKVLDCICCNIREGSVYGIVGVNGAGKSTLLRIIAGVIKADGGLVTADGEDIYNNPRVKAALAFVSDDPYLEEGASLYASARMYRMFYKKFSMDDFYLYCQRLGLDEKKNVSKMSKGQRRRAAIALALATRPDYLIMDETFDGLDPIIRAKVKKLIFDRVSENGMSVIMTTHSLRELEDTCDTLALLSEGKMVLECDVEQLKSTVFKIQVMGECDLSAFDVMSDRERGRLREVTLRGDRGMLESALSDAEFYDILPLSLDEIFECEAERRGMTV